MSEIERKFRLNSLPPAVFLGEGVPIAQGYILNDATELRVRRKGSRCYLTVKSDGTLAREEWETEIPSHVFDSLWPHTDGRRIEKTRYTIARGPLIVEVDDYHGHLSGLVILECEFPDERSSGQFTLPEWAKDAIDVTEDAHYRNKRLAIAGLPSPLP